MTQLELYLKLQPAYRQYTPLDCLWASLNSHHPSLGYPVMIKASAGGGGKGMRIAWNDEETKQEMQFLPFYLILLPHCWRQLDCKDRQ